MGYPVNDPGWTNWRADAKGRYRIACEFFHIDLYHSDGNCSVCKDRYKSVPAFRVYENGDILGVAGAPPPVLSDGWYKDFLENHPLPEDSEFRENPFDEPKKKQEFYEPHAFMEKFPWAMPVARQSESHSCIGVVSPLPQELKGYGRGNSDYVPVMEHRYKDKGLSFANGFMPRSLMEYRPKNVADWKQARGWD